MQYMVCDYFTGRLPGRFTPEEKAKRPQLSYFPFGSGPRSCIGVRYALLVAKMVLIELMKKFTLVKVPETEVMFCVFCTLLIFFILLMSVCVAHTCRYLWK